MVKLDEHKKQILKAEFPRLSLTEDFDIERYFELRKTGKSGEAIHLYNNKLKHKYPDEKMRISLMSAYRKKAPYFNSLLTICLSELADKTIERIKRVISFIADKAGEVNEKDVYSVVRSCETVVSAISQDRFEAVSFTDKYSKYAELLDFKKNQMKKAAELIRQYVTDTLLSLRIYREEQAEKKRAALKTHIPKPAFDFSKINFTKEQTESILIPENITVVEDKVLAYTLKYWEIYADYAFENLILLYSRKFATNHYNIFQAVKLGRIGKKRDEEILHNVLLNVVNGYYYSISGDLYLQREWARIKPSTAVKLIKKHESEENRQTTTESHETEEKSEKHTADFKENEKNKKGKKADNCPADNRLKGKNTNPTAEPIIKQNTNETDNNAISEMIKRLTGKDYSIYEELFFKTVRPSIRRSLEKNTSQKIYIFSEKQNKAEDIVFEYLEQNYSAPYQNWEKSSAKEEVENLGFSLSTIEEIVEHWVKTKL